MSNREKACQLIYQLAAHVQLSILSGLSGWGCGAEGLGPGPYCLSVMVLAIWPWTLGDRVKMNEWSVFTGSCRHRGHHLLVRPGVLNLRAKLAADTLLREYITRWEWMRRSGGEKPQADAWVRKDNIKSILPSGGKNQKSNKIQETDKVQKDNSGLLQLKLIILTMIHIGSINIAHIRLVVEIWGCAGKKSQTEKHKQSENHIRFTDLQVC